MAPKTLKRPAAAPAGAGIAKKCKVVADALYYAELPEVVTEMLAGNLAVSLGVAKEDRHPCQDEVVAMVGETLDSVEAAAQARIAALEGQLAEAGTEKGKRDAAAEEAAAAAAAKAAATEAAKTAVTEGAAALKGAKAALAAAEAEQKAGNAGLEATIAKKTKLETALNGTYTPVKTGTAEPDTVKDGVSALVKLGKEFQFDPSMLTSLPAALCKAPDARGSFDAMVLTQLEEEMGKRIAELDEELAKEEPAKTERAGKVAATTAALEEAVATEAAAKAALKEAQAAQKEAEVAQKAAAKSVKDFDPEMKQVTANLEDQKTSFEKLTAGALATYKELLARSSAPPPEEEVAEEAPPAPVV